MIRISTTLLPLTLALGVIALMPSEARSAEARVTGGIHEIAIGVPDLVAAIDYWQAFGFAIHRRGGLEADAAEALYQHDSALTAVRLSHRSLADHGHIRLWSWDETANDGLKQAPMLAPGSRWISTLTSNLVKIWNHGVHAQEQGAEITLVPPQFSTAYGGDLAGEPFVDPLSGVREMIILDDLYRRMFFQRFDYAITNYGAIDPNARMETSQITHVGLVYASDDPETSGFYERALGLYRATPQESYRTWDNLGADARAVYGMDEDDAYFGTTYDDPRNAALPWNEAYSGRMLLRRIPLDKAGEDFTAQAQPGVLGLSLYTLTTPDLEGLRARLMANGAAEVSAIMPNEFGQPALSFRAPDGHLWSVIETP